MSVADTPAGPDVVELAQPPRPLAHPLPPQVLPQLPPPAAAAPIAPWNLPYERPEQDLPPDSPLAGLSRSARQLLALSFVVAWIACIVVEPTPDGPDPHYQLWLLPIDLFSLAALVVGVVLVWRGHRRAPLWGVLAGVGMAVETVLCPATGHHMVGGFTWVQTALSLFVLVAGAALPRLARLGRDRLASQEG